MDGFEVVRMLDRPPLVVFTTAYDAYAIKAFEIHALDYLLKPIPEKRLRAAIERALEEWNRIDGGGQPDWQARLLEAVNSIAPASRGLRRIPIRQGEKIRLVDLEDVKWFYVQDKLVSLVSDNGEMDTQFTTIQQLERKLDPEKFFRVHRGVVVNLGHIREIRPWFNGTLKLVMDDAQSTELDVSREQARKLKEVVGW
jgi:DNA-binding LytR/AlgR family response regulator